MPKPGSTGGAQPRKYSWDHYSALWHEASDALLRAAHGLLSEVRALAQHGSAVLRHRRNPSSIQQLASLDPLA